MRARLELRRWGGAASNGVYAGRAALAERAGLFVALSGEAGLVGLGEASPLPGYSPETLAEVEACLAGLDAAPLWQATLGESPLEALDRALGGEALLPSARFALESAVLDLHARRLGGRVWRVLCKDMATPDGADGEAIHYVWEGHRHAGDSPGSEPTLLVPRSVLVGLVGDPSARERARAAVERGAKTLKLKASGEDPRAEAAWSSALREELGARVRLDLNGALRPEAARAALGRYAEAGVELVEEPCAGAALLELGPCGVPWLADESLADPELAEALLRHPGCGGVVLKPSVLGGLRRSAALAERALRAGKRVVVTHAFEGPVGLAAVAELALAVAARCRALGAPSLPAGVDGHAGLATAPAVALAQLPERGAGGELAIVDAPRAGLGVDAAKLGFEVAS